MKSLLVRAFYSIILMLLSPFLLVKLLKKKAGKPSVGKRWKEYFGITPPLISEAPIWIHTVSVGETIAATPLIKAIKKAYPNTSILLTTTTTTGAEQAAKLGELVEHRYMPIDFSWCVRGLLKATRPRCLLIMETELWPNTLHTVSKADIPISVLNARLSERSCHRYQKVQPIFDLISRNVDLFLCQHIDDASRFNRLGVPTAKTSVTGSLKFDISIAPEITESGGTLRKQLGKDRPIWIAASTHEGEDEQLLKAHQKLLLDNPESLLILVPRHPERFASVIELSQSMKLETVSRSSKDKISEATQVYVADTMGEMLLLIQSADICFMAGSLIGDKVGGHNLLEPAALGKPMLNGPSYFNFTDIANQLLRAEALTICESSDQITDELRRLFSDEDLQTQMGQRALDVVKENQGAVQKTLTAIERYIS